MKIFPKLSTIARKNKLVPKLMLGSSPFVGAGQFEGKALVYFEQFAKNPINIVRLLVKSVEFGVPAIQIFPEPWIVDAVKEAEKITGKKIYVIASIGYRLDTFEKDLEEISDLNLQAVLTHARITDMLDKELIGECLKKIKKLDVLSGVVTHTPAKTLPQLTKFDLEFDVAMVPVNNFGYMATPASLEAIKRFKKTLMPIIIGKKILAAGKLKPKDAFKFAYKYADGVVVGITSEEEMVETYNAAKGLMK